eukprot:GHVH01004339.1.p1 GENE.GHVH01004339.1~~GHVH01004339.1.p1  ORF type:complete len:389 (+),score=25.29 GHVH01004339.1:46-1212(+)
MVTTPLPYCLTNLPGDPLPVKLCLGIESSANKIGVGIVDRDGAILSNPRRTYSSPPGTGFLPRATAQHHRDVVSELIKEALKLANVTLQSIDLIAYTRGPGVGTCLSVGALVARTLSLRLRVPLVGVNHCVAHIEMGRLITKSENPVVLYASGGNTQIIAYSDGIYSIWGETLDVAAGNCIDRVARILSLPNAPAPGWQIEQQAKNGTKLLPIPYCVKGMDMSFAGIVSKVEDLMKLKKGTNMKTQCDVKRQKTSKGGPNFEDQVDKLTGGGTLQDISVANICYSLQEVMFSMLIEVTERVMAATGSNSILLVGGVGCNLDLQNKMKAMCSERVHSFVCAMDDRYCVDNGAMIAHTGLLTYFSGLYTPIDRSDFSQRYRTDKVPIVWR